MPIYEYRCSSCGHQQEFLQKVSDAQLTTCTQCGKPSFTKMLSAAGFQLKGSGWYATDFKNSGSKPAAKSGGETKASGDSKPSGDAKPSGESKASGEAKGGEKKAAPAGPPAA
ncbi:MAG: zinc ribbon domain-containing protein [Burkholderiales bacterium]|nr:zinc ribbon domain-containing protein [Burkholderiales bacterium]